MPIFNILPKNGFPGISGSSQPLRQPVFCGTLAVVPWRAALDPLSERRRDLRPQRSARGMRGECEQNDVPPHQETPQSGTRPAALTEPAPQWRAATVSYVAAPALLLATPILGGGNALDDSVLAFFGGGRPCSRRRKRRRG